uniref:Uncharacterized protein n=1 Tax=Anguilla anguilla TaxID=7936 RepID=A0A0E9QVH7_ANGAN
MSFRCAKKKRLCEQSNENGPFF